jgi:REP element-mobilizing transposase RayT
MSPPPLETRGYLPRLSADHYRGRSVVFWTHTIKHRARGWLDEDFHQRFRELILHVAIREQMLCPIYIMMPDHIHHVWMGVSAASDQQRASVFLRRHLESALTPFQFQHQAYDHVLRERERKRNAFAATCAYIADNPARAGLITDARLWPFTGCMVPGYPSLHPLAPDFWVKFWRIYRALVERGSLFQPTPA